MNEQLIHLLDQFWLSETEKTLFLASLVIGPTSIIWLSSYTKHKRLTTHHAISSMIEQWLFLETHYGKKRLVYANTIDGLEQVLEKKKHNLNQLEQGLNNSKHLFNYLLSSRENFPQTRLYQGIEGINTTLLEIAKDKTTTALVMYDSNAFGTLVDEKIFHRSHSTRSKNKTITKLIMPSDFRDYRNLEWKEDYHVSIKIIPEQLISNGGISIRGNKTALHCYKEWFVTTTIIENKQIAWLMTLMYDTMRKSAKDYQEGFLLV